MSRKIVSVKYVVKSAGCKGCNPAPWERNVSCTGVNCSKNLAALAKEWDSILLKKQRAEGYVTIGEIRRMEGRVEAAEIAAEDGHVTQEELDLLVGELEGMKLLVPRRWSTMPKWSDVAEMHPPDLSGISIGALRSALAYMDAFAKRCGKLRKAQHPAARAKIARIQAGLETGNFKAIWLRAKACQAVYQSRKVVAKSAISPLKAAIWAAEQREIREYEAGYRVVKGAQEEGAYLFPEETPNLAPLDLKEMERAPMSEKEVQGRAACLAHLQRLDGYDFTLDFPTPEVVEEVAY